MRRAKQIVFRYDGDPTTEESDVNVEIYYLTQSINLKRAVTAR